MDNTNPIQVQKFLGGMDYPAHKGQLLSHAQENGAPESVVDTLNKIPEMEYESPAQLTEETGKL